MKKRLDSLLVEKGIATGRDSAKELILNNQIFVDGKLATKPSMLLLEDSEIDFRGELTPYVSRGGIKLEKAAHIFKINLENMICMDIGASTGGFTDYLLQNGAKMVYALDVGSGQLVDKIRNDSRVVVMENTNIRHLDKSSIIEKVDFICADVSFISLKLVLPKIYQIIKQDGQVICLVKPQFEAGPENVGKNGIVKDKKVHKKVLENISKYASDLGFSVLDIILSPIKGQKGNLEYLLYLKRDDDNHVLDSMVIENLLYN